MELHGTPLVLLTDPKCGNYCLPVTLPPKENMEGDESFPVVTLHFSFCFYSSSEV